MTFNSRKYARLNAKLKTDYAALLSMGIHRETARKSLDRRAGNVAKAAGADPAKPGFFSHVQDVFDAIEARLDGDKARANAGLSLRD
jgi:hypothetical protein